MKREIFLDLYGTVSFDAEDDDVFWQLIQTDEVARSREISLSSTPSAFAPHGVALSRFQHSIAVGFLARKLCDKRPTIRPWRNALIAAGICHDLGSSCFSHNAEIFSYTLTGRTHEQQVARLINNKTAIGRLLSSAGIDPAEVVALINGSPDHPLGRLIAGDVDLDNISNSQDLLRSLGYRDELFYHPLKLVEAYRFQQERLVLDSSYMRELFGWREARRQLYALLASEPNESAGAMLYRAIEFAFAEGALDEKFFRLSEPDALYYLRNEAGEETQRLIRAEYRWRHYPRLLEIAQDEDMRLVSLYDDWQLRKTFTDELARSLAIKPSEFCLYVGRDRSEKRIRLPFIGPHADAASAFFGGTPVRQRVSLFAHKRHAELRDSARVRDALEAAITQLPAADRVEHVFT